MGPICPIISLETKDPPLDIYRRPCWFGINLYKNRPVKKKKSLWSISLTIIGFPGGVRARAGGVCGGLECVNGRIKTYHNMGPLLTGPTVSTDIRSKPLKTNRLSAFALSVIATLGVTPVLASPSGDDPQKEVVSRSTVVVLPEAVSQQGVTAFDLRKSSTPRAFALATEAFWDELAQCETGQDWANGGKWAGGLGIYTQGVFGSPNMGTWERFGGEEFAPSPKGATRAEQIIVANRISVEGWTATVRRDPRRAKIMGVPVTYEWKKEPVGFGGWGCYRSKSTGKYRMAKPQLYYYPNFEDVPLFSFKFNERSKAAHDLQVFLGLVADGHYGKKTRAAHISYLKKKRLPTGGILGFEAGPVVAPNDFPERTEQTKRCPTWESHLASVGLPVREFSYIMWRESRCQPKVIGWNYRDGMSKKYCDKNAPAHKYKNCRAVASYDSGLLQINSTWVTVTQWACGAPRGDLNVLLNPRCNLSVAKYLYDNGGFAHWAIT